MQVLLMAAVLLQTAEGARANPHGPASAAAVAVAARATRPPVIDGRDDDEVWRTAQRITEFREFDPSPDSILSLLARRDIRTASDQIKIIIDSYHDRRTGYEFAVNPAGVKRDYSIYNDGNEDAAWDGIWDAATRIDSLGWTAEFRIPLSQLRYATTGDNTFGFGVWRDIQRHGERVSWPLWRRTVNGLSSQLGEIRGLQNLAPPRRLEVLPYAVTKNVSVPEGGDAYGREQRVTGGLDLKYRVTSNLTLDATMNPDFGQIEADPGVLNLSAFETFFQERRPFFVEGTGIFQVPINCSVVNCSGEALFYSRRVGRAPQLSGAYGDATSPTGTTILGAGKLTGRLPSGLTLGMFEAVTAREVGTQGRTIEPATNYGVFRAQQDFRRGETGVGVLLTTVNRRSDEWTDASVRDAAYVAAVDFRHRFKQGRYSLSGSLDLSRVEGSQEAIAATQRSAVHYYQRPDGALRYDPTRTGLSGNAQEIKFGKFGGGITRFETSYLRRSPGFEANDLGFLLRADEQSWNNWFSFNLQRPTRLYRMAFWNFNWWQYWTAAGLPTERAANTNLHVQLPNRWWLHGGGTLGSLGEVYCDRCARGGPALRQSRGIFPWFGIEGDDRPMVVPSFWVNYGKWDEGRSERINLNPSIQVRVAAPVRASLSFNYTRNRAHTQWYGNPADDEGVTHYTFAHLDQTTASLTTRLDYTFSPTLSLQLYGQPFVSKGTYSDVRELDDPRAADYDDRFKPYLDQEVTQDPGGFNFKQLRSNLVLRWEYSPGSSLFLVWNQGRTGSLDDEGNRSIPGNFRDLFRLRADNTLLLKASYWLNW